MPLKDVEEIVARNQKSVVIIDEAYIDFGGESALSLTRKYEKSADCPDFQQIPFYGRNEDRLCHRASGLNTGLK